MVDVSGGARVMLVDAVAMAVTLLCQEECAPASCHGDAAPAPRAARRHRAGSRVHQHLAFVDASDTGGRWRRKRKAAPASIVGAGPHQAWASPVRAASRCHLQTVDHLHLGLAGLVGDRLGDPVGLLGDFSQRAAKHAQGASRSANVVQEQG